MLTSPIIIIHYSSSLQFVTNTIGLICNDKLANDKNAQTFVTGKRVKPGSNFG